MARRKTGRPDSDSIVFAARSRSGFRLAQIATRHPSRASPDATANPMPFDAASTTATRSRMARSMALAPAYGVSVSPSAQRSALNFQLQKASAESGQPAVGGQPIASDADSRSLKAERSLKIQSQSLYEFRVPLSAPEVAGHLVADSRGHFGVRKALRPEPCVDAVQQQRSDSRSSPRRADGHLRHVAIELVG